MIYKENNYEKVVDLGKGFKELFRIYTEKLESYYTLREIKTITDEETQYIIDQDQQKQLISHPNLIQIIYKQCELQKSKQKKNGEQQKQQLNKIDNQQIQNTYWKIQRLMPNIQCTLDTFIKNHKNNQKNLYEQQQLANMSGLMSNIEESQSVLYNNSSGFFDVSLEIQKHMQKMQEKAGQMFPDQGENNSDIFQQKKEALQISEYFKFQKKQQDIENQELQENRFLDPEFIQLFLKQFLNLLAGMEFKELPIRDIYPQNIFVPTIQPNQYDLLLGDMDEYQKFFYPDNVQMSQKVSFTKMSENFIGYMSPEMKIAYFQRKYRENRFNIYKSGLFSLGLVTLYLASLEDAWGQNVQNDEKINKKIKELLRIVKKQYGRKLKNIIKKMLIMDENQRFSFRELDEDLQFNDYIEQNLKFESKSFAYQNAKDMDSYFNDKNNLKNFIDNTRNIRFFKVEQIQFSKWFDKVFNQQNIQFQNKIEEFHIMWSDFTMMQIKQIFDNNSMKNLVKLQISGVDKFYARELDHVLKNLEQDEIKIKFLDFSASLFDHHCMEILVSFPKICQNLSGLNLNSNRDITDKGVFILGQNIENFNNLKYLYLGGIDVGCQLTQLSIDILGEFLEQNKINQDSKTKQFLKKLKVLDLSWNKFGTESLLHILNNQNFVQLEQLNLSKCQIDISSYRFSMKQKQILKNIILDE